MKTAGVFIAWDRVALRALASALAALAWIALASGVAHSGAGPERALEELVVVSGERRHVFEVEVADTDASRAQGLMFRRSMPENHGMLFDFKVEAPVSMWMKNTYISLDMLFIRRDGTIARVAEHAEPLSLRSIASGSPVLAVLELNAGTARRLGIKAGDRVEHPLFSGG